MMDWLDIVSITFACVAANHMGLIGKLEENMGEIPIIDCPKCFAFWSVLAYGLWHVGFSDLPVILAVSFLVAYIATWLDLFMGIIDYFYMKIYEKITATDNGDTTSADAKRSNTNGTVS